MASNKVITLGIKLATYQDTQQLSGELIRSDGEPKEGVRQLINLLEAGISGTKPLRVDAVAEDVTVGDRATATATCVSVAENDALIIGPITLTAKDVPSGENQVDVGATDTIMATNFAAAINGHSALEGLVEATSATNVVTITAVMPGRIGELVTLAETGTTITVSAALLTGVTATLDTAQVTYDCGVP